MRILDGLDVIKFAPYNTSWIVHMYMYMYVYCIDDLYLIWLVYGKGRQYCEFTSIPSSLYRVAVWWLLGAWASHLHSLPPLTTVTRPHPPLCFSASHVRFDLCPWGYPWAVLGAKCLCWCYQVIVARPQHWQAQLHETLLLWGETDRKNYLFMIVEPDFSLLLPFLPV